MEFNLFTPGSYELVETKASTGYELGNIPFACYFTITDTDLRKTISITSENSSEDKNDWKMFLLKKGSKQLLTKDGLGNIRKRGVLKIYKKDGDTGKTIDGVTFSLFKKSDTTSIICNIFEFITGKTYDNVGTVLDDSSGQTIINAKTK